MSDGKSTSPSCTTADFPRADLFRAIGDPNRMKILANLASCCGGSKTVTEIATEVPKDVSVVSRHLAKLRDAGALRAERHGKEVRYFCCYEELVGALRSLADAIEACCPTDPDSKEAQPSARAQT